MGDRSALSLYVWDCPPDKVGAVLDVLEEYNLENTSGGTDANTLELASLYMNEEISLGTEEEVASALIAAGGISFEVWQDPKYEFMGALVAHTPTLGTFTADCDADGNATPNVDAVLGILDTLDPKMTVGRARPLVDKRLGRLHHQALRRLGQQNDGKTLASPRCDECMTRLMLADPADPESWVHAEDGEWGDHTATPRR